MTLLELIDVYGNTLYVSKTDWDKGRILTPLRFKSGRKYLDLPHSLRPRGGVMIHRDNVAKIVKEVEPRKRKENAMKNTSEVIKVERSESSKFDDTLVERLHEMTMEGWATEELGDVQDFGWYGLLLFGDDPITAEYDDELEKVAAAILTEDSQGFVYADTFTTEKAAKKQWSKIEDEYEEFAKEAEAEEAEEEEESEW